MYIGFIDSDSDMEIKVRIVQNNIIDGLFMNYLFTLCCQEDRFMIKDCAC